MLRQLLVLRHGKSDWGAGFEVDFERPLKKRGIRAAKRIGRFLAERDQRPDLALSSSAVRARETARLAAAAGEWTCPLRLTGELYETTPDSVLELVRGTDDDVRRLLVVGHEPTSSALVGLLTGAPAPRFPTAALACVAFDAPSWSALRPGAGELTWLVTPRSLD